MAKLRLAAVTATVAGWMLNPETTVPESRAPMMVDFIMVRFYWLYCELALPILFVLVACREVECFFIVHDMKRNL